VGRTWFRRFELFSARAGFFPRPPLALHFLLGYQGNIGGAQAEALPGIGNYLSFVTRFMFGFGIAFLLPVLLLLLNAAGLVTRQQLKKGRRYAIVVAFVIAAVLTPPDVVSQLLLAVPLLLLYEVSMVAIWFTDRKRAKAAAAAKP
jgi:sec-independent protein translocase protein TatC